VVEFTLKRILILIILMSVVHSLMMMIHKIKNSSKILTQEYIKIVLIVKDVLNLLLIRSLQHI